MRSDEEEAVLARVRRERSLSLWVWAGERGGRDCDAALGRLASWFGLEEGTGRGGSVQV